LRFKEPCVDIANFPIKVVIKSVNGALHISGLNLKKTTNRMRMKNILEVFSE